MKVVVCLLAAVLSLAGAEPKLGVLKNGNIFELSLIFEEPVDTISLQNPESYAISAGEIVTTRLIATNRGVILGVNGLSANTPVVLSINHVRDPALNELPPQQISFNTGARFWTVIGGNELGLPANVTAFSTNGFDVLSGGIQQRDEYDEATFAGELISGNFDVMVRVDFVAAAGAGAKAGIMIREEMDEGKSRPLDPTDPVQSFSRYIELAVRNSLTADNQPGIAMHQILVRPAKGSFVTDSLTVTNNAPPEFTNAWLRVERVGNEFKMYRGTDGVVWQQIGSANFESAAPEALYVGVAFSPQNDDLSPSSNLRDSFVAKFRDYELEVESSAEIFIRKTGATTAELRWEGLWTLQTVTNLTNQWMSAPVQTNPQTINTDEKLRFFRLFRAN